MIKIFETEKIKELDQYTIEQEPVASIDLVERAATAFVREYGRHYTKQNRVIVFAGQGNNGADALAVARLLGEEDYRVETYLINPSRQLSPDCEENKRRLRNVAGVQLLEVTDDDDFIPPLLTAYDVVVDGLFGSGLNRPLDEGYALLADYINRSPATVVSIDIPSGLFGEDNRANRPDSIIRADRTFTFGFPKLAFLLPENAPFVGKWKLLPIGIHPAIVERTETRYNLVTDADLASLLHTRNPFDHKGVFGHALLIAGGRGKMGAAVLAATACLRSGVGQLTVHIPQRGETTLQTAVPEAMLSLDENEDMVSQLPDLSRYKAIGIGPGIGTHPASVALLRHLLESTDVPLALDADALNILSSNKEWLALLPPHTLLTPHPKEFDRLAGNSVSGYERLHKAIDMAVRYNLCILLKGAYSATCTSEGKVYFNYTGNPGMATAGSGDVLTGIVLGLLAQGYTLEQAAIAGAWLHGLAGDLAVTESSKESLIASDLIRKLGSAFKSFWEEDE